MQRSADYPTRQPPPPEAELPRTEPEIIPPGADIHSRTRPEATIFVQRGSQIHVETPGPFGIALILLLAGAAAAAGLLVLLGAALIGAAAAGAIVLGAMLSRLVSGAVRR
jgi:hypothetical protein